MSTSGAVLAAKSLDCPDAVRRFPHGHVDIVEVAGRTVGRMVFEPGWHWSVHMAPAAGTGSCRVLHVGVVLSGRLAVRMDDGTGAVAAPGDVFVIGPGHDGWVLGDEPCVLVDWAGAGDYARHRTGGRQGR